MSKKHVAFSDELLAKRISQHFREFHAADSATLRRTFLRSAAGLAGLGVCGLSTPGLARAEDEDGGIGKSVLPKPIPGGVSPLGIFIHHMPVSPTGTPLQNLTEPSQITDFKGFVGLNRIRGAGSGKGFPSLAYQADMGFMKGVFIGEDGKHHQGAFAFIWLDIYTGPVGQAVLTTQIHDYSPPIAANGLFWTIPIDPDSLRVELGDARASLRITDLAIPDFHDLANNLTNGHGLANPPIPPIAAVPATVSFDVEWSGEISRGTVVNEMQNFSGDFIKTGSTIKWSSVQNGFFFESEDPNPSRNIGTVIGREGNGVFFGQEGDVE